MVITYIVADPAGNTTGLVKTSLSRDLYADVARELMASSPHHLEQVGFLEAHPEYDGMLQMMGGEFCGNAARSFGLYLVLSEPALQGRDQVVIGISGVEDPLTVNVDPKSREARIRMPRIHKMERLETESYGLVPVVHMEGISHALVFEGPDPTRAAHLLTELAGQIEADAIGIMFYEEGKGFLTPLVWVKTTDTSIWESSCGSGSVSLAAWLKAGAACPWTVTFAEPGGLIKVEGLSDTELWLGGPVTFSEPITVNLIVNADTASIT